TGVVGERDAAEAAAVGRHGRILREFLPRVERERRRAATEAEAHPVVVLLPDWPAEALVVEAPGANEVPDAEGDHRDVRLHRGWRRRSRAPDLLERRAR